MQISVALDLARSLPVFARVNRCRREGSMGETSGAERRHAVSGLPSLTHFWQLHPRSPDFQPNTSMKARRQGRICVMALDVFVSLHASQGRAHTTHSLVLTAPRRLENKRREARCTVCWYLRLHNMKTKPKAVPYNTLPGPQISCSKA